MLLAVSQKTANNQALREALLRAIAAGKKLKTLVKNQPKLEQYPATIPLLALQVILDKISEQEQIKESSLLQRKMTCKLMQVLSLASVLAQTDNFWQPQE